MSYQLTVYAVGEGHIRDVSGVKRQTLVDAFLKSSEALDQIDEQQIEGAEDWGEDTTNILPSRDAIRHIVFDEEMEPGQASVYSAVVMLICESLSNSLFIDWYGPNPMNIFDWVEKEAQVHGKKLDILDLIVHDSPFNIPDNLDVNIGFWDNRTCRKKLKIVKKMMRNRSKSPNAGDSDGYARLDELKNWLETTLKTRGGSLVGIYY